MAVVRLGYLISSFARWIPKEDEGDFRDWGEIESWAVGIADALKSLN
jgi:hypothetical protein